MHVRTPPCEINICTAIAILLAETCYTYPVGNERRIDEQFQYPHRGRVHT